MKHLLLVLLLAGCVGSVKDTTLKTPPPVPAPVVIHDTVYVPTAPIVIPCNLDSLRKVTDSLATAADTLADRLLLARLQLRNVKYYMTLAAKPSQQKFLLGWLRRVVK